jgi:hypothetical protein
LRGDKQKTAGKKERACRKARNESSKREREEGRMSEEGLNPFRKSSRTEDPQVEAKKEIKAKK